ncbi:motility associated factor glycosyltransferase family protein [Tumebacillus algifaecis]|nr:6-hydroxymethylpterin diphosphokinase MptE-like protein [Tumebacillus algifaecis]
MSGFLEQNEAALRERSVLFDHYIAQKHSAGQSVRVELSKAGVPTLFTEGEGQSGYLYSRYQPLVEAERWATAQKVDARGQLVYGLGLGYHLRALRAATGDKIPLFVVEPSWDIFLAAMEATDLTDLLRDPHLMLSVGPEMRRAAKDAAYFIGQHLFAVEWLEWPAYRRSFPQAMQLFTEATTVEVKDVRIEQNTILFFQKEWPRNLLYNLDKILKNPGINHLRDKITGRPAVIVSAGPSLSKNIELLHEMKGKAAILCVDTAYRVLQQRGIRPDLIFALDGSDKNYKHFTGVQPEGVPLVFLPAAHHKIVEEYGEKTFTSNVNDQFLRDALQEVEPKGAISHSGSVATLAFETACLMGAEPIIFIGQDLAYPGGQAYAPGTMFETMTKSIEDGRLMMHVEGVDGQPVLTDASLDKYRRYFEERIEELAEEHLFIDATEGGAKIAGTEITTLWDVIERFCQEEFDFEQVIEAAAAPTGEDLEPARQTLRKMRRTLHQIARLNRIALLKNRDLRDLYKVRRLRVGKVEDMSAELDRLEQLIKRLNEKKWLDTVMQSLILYLTEGKMAQAPEQESEHAKAMRVTENAEILYHGMLEAAEEIKSHVNVALDRIGEENKQGEDVR